MLLKMLSFDSFLVKGILLPVIAETNVTTCGAEVKLIFAAGHFDLVICANDLALGHGNNVF